MRKIYKKSEFIKMQPKMLHTWLAIHKTRLIGSAIFTSNNSLVSKIVSWASSWGKKAEFVPSHVGSIIEHQGNLFVFDMKPPRASMTPLANFLLYTNDDYKLILRDFDLNTQWFSSDMIFHLNEFYPYLSAIRSVFTKRNTKFVNHCSELHARLLQRQGLFNDFNPECTPLELYELLNDKQSKKVS